MVIIVPAAGLSTRFPNNPPKYLLRDGKGVLMLARAIEPLYRYRIVAGLLQQHIDEFQALDVLKEEFGNRLMYAVIPTVTRGPADTVYQIMQQVSLSGACLVKDCDSYFEHQVWSGNYVCTTTVAEHNVLLELGSKSFVVTNDQQVITDIIEKQVVSDKFCVGGYKFESTAEYMAAFEKISAYPAQRELFVSHVIQQMLLEGHIFVNNNVVGYQDVGTLHDWRAYNNVL